MSGNDTGVRVMKTNIYFNDKFVIENSINTFEFALFRDFLQLCCFMLTF